MLSSTVLGLLRNPETPDHVLRDAVLEEAEAVANVYVVCGERGEYSDWTTWSVAAFLEKAHADEFAKRLNDWHMVNWVHRDCYDWRKAEAIFGEDRENWTCPLDPQGGFRWDQPNYVVDTIPLRAED